MLISEKLVSMEAFFLTVKLFVFSHLISEKLVSMEAPEAPELL